MLKNKSMITANTAWDWCLMALGTIKRGVLVTCFLPLLFTVSQPSLANEPEQGNAGEQVAEEGAVLIDLNTASLSDLQQLVGIGKSKAEAIIRYREEQGSFASIEELTAVKGIGQKLLDKNKARLTVSQKE